MTYFPGDFIPFQPFFKNHRWYSSRWSWENCYVLHSSSMKFTTGTS